MPSADLTTIEAFSLAAAIVSIVLAVFAIALSIVFYRWSDKASENADKASATLTSSVERIEKLYDTFYRDTFGLVKETYKDFRSHSWESQGTEADTGVVQKFDALKADLQREVDTAITRGTSTQQEVEALRSQLESVVSSAVDRSREVEDEIVEKQIRPFVLRRIREAEATGESAMTLHSFLRDIPSGGGRYFAALNVLLKLKEAGTLSVRMEPEWLDHETLPEVDTTLRFDFSS